MAYSGELPPWARRASPAGGVATGRSSRRQRLRLEGSNIPSAHLIPAADR
jgi:hypothetical protein